MTKNLLTTTLLLFALVSIGVTQSINTSASLVTFEVNNMKFRTVEGSFDGMDGRLTFDQSNLELCEFDVCIDATTLKTGNSKRDNHLQQPDFFDTANHNQICFVSDLIKPANNGYAVVGQLDLKGISRSVMIPFTFDGTTFNGNLTLSRSDYGIGEGTNNFQIGDAISIQIKCVVN